ncbi:hypothetical protein GCM10011391_22730 [Pullulanibacillus camelliae]|uniref:bis(5'-nucleosyl)-tetraphosphatase (symmetrical) n=1 Tax=Pullulanibacillus camelliae TaxID=1707096 RepID=A0A8J3DUS3_9BACL|nr:bis(5'-nucleosyl)-tetraphosphatase (symmetrical) YqeK [Pullulanibacillus camelliae]GGE43364.1 hypothetical protein GCM10011391_22730 [Pullulanibacillus camelliae]
MTKDDAIKKVRELLPDARYEHTLRVAETAVTLAKQYGADQEKAELAGILHDIAKYFPEDELYRTISSHPEIPNVFLNYHSSIWHAPVGAVYVQEQLGLLDLDIYNAITYHTTGRAGMSLLEKIIFLADYIEPGRDHPGVEPVRKLANKSLDQAVSLALVNTINYLIERYSPVFPDTIAAYNDLIRTTGKLLKQKA